jgi:hypothetical protein
MKNDNFTEPRETGVVIVHDAGLVMYSIALGGTVDVDNSSTKTSTKQC